MSIEMQGSASSVVSRNMKIDGEVSGKENLSIEGFVKGVIRLDGNLHVEGAGEVEADIEATNVVIRGKVSGNVKAHRQLEIAATGKLFGVIRAGSIDIKEGAVFEGRSHMISKTEAAGAPKPAKSPARTVEQEKRSPKSERSTFNKTKKPNSLTKDSSKIEAKKNPEQPHLPGKK